MTSHVHATAALALTFFLFLAGCRDISPSASRESARKPLDDSETEAFQGSAETTIRNDQLDQEQILGSWHSVFAEKDGQQVPDLVGSKFVFTKDAFDLIGIRNEYRLDPSVNPKQIDYSTLGLEKPFVGIYQLEGDKLKICFATSVGRLRPVEFKTFPDDGNLLVVLNRSTTELPEPGNTELEPSLSSTIDDAIDFLERNEIENYLERLVVPNELQGMKQTGWDKTVEYVSEQREAFLNTLRVLPKLKPTMNHNLTEAVFDLSKIHIPNP